MDTRQWTVKTSVWHLDLISFKIVWCKRVNLVFRVYCTIRLASFVVTHSAVSVLVRILLNAQDSGLHRVTLHSCESRPLSNGREIGVCMPCHGEYSG